MCGGSTSGCFPQIAGMAFSFDTSLPEGDRVQSLVITDADGNLIDTVAQNGELVGDADCTFRMVTITFLVEGGDDYPYVNFSNTNRVDFTEVMTEAQSGRQATFSIQKLGCPINWQTMPRLRFASIHQADNLFGFWISDSSRQVPTLVSRMLLIGTRRHTER